MFKKRFSFSTVAALFFSCLFTCPLLLSQDAPKTLHVLITLDSISHDIRHSTNADYNIIRHLLRSIPKNKLQVQAKVLKKKDLTVKNMEAWISALKVGKDDGVFFYYSGHGIGGFPHKLLPRSSSWPLLQIQDGKEYVPASMIIKALQKKRPRLLVVMTDCCNNYVQLKGGSNASTSFSQKKPEHSFKKLSKKAIKNVVSLFLHSRGVKAITASKPGKPAGATVYGGIMTNLFFATVLEYRGKKPLSWKKTFERIEKEGRFFHQTPHYHIIKKAK